MSASAAMGLIALGLEVAKFVRHEQRLADLAAKAGATPEDLQSALVKEREDYKKLRDPNTLAEVTE